jgi:Amt family ammonium transporter
VNEGGADGLLYGGAALLGKQVLAVVAVMVFTFVATWIIAKIVDATVGLRVEERVEIEGLDISLHEERAYVTDSR